MPLDIYQKIELDTGLQQGDIIDKSPDVLGVIGKALPEGEISRASGLIILTQSCDLVRRSRRGCKAKYINLAVFAPLADNLISLLDDICERACLRDDIPMPGMYKKKDYIKAMQFLERIVNQTEEDKALFFLPPNASAGIGVHSVAYLQVSVPLKINSYEILLANLRGRLKIEYQNRLGWLVGNIYSRVAIHDVEDSEKEIIFKSFLKPDDNADGPFWFYDDVIKAAQESPIESDGKTNREIHDLLNSIELKTPMTKAIELVLEIFKKNGWLTDESNIRKARHELKQNDIFRSYIKKRD